MESLLRVPEVPSGSGKARKGRKTPTDKHERQAADPAAWRTIMAQLHGRRVEVDAMKPMQHIPAVKPSCASSPTPPPPSPSPQVYLTHMHINMQHTLSCSSAPPATAPCAAPRRAAPLSSPLSLSPPFSRAHSLSAGWSCRPGGSPADRTPPFAHGPCRGSATPTMKATTGACCPATGNKTSPGSTQR